MLLIQNAAIVNAILYQLSNLQGYHSRHVINVEQKIKNQKKAINVSMIKEGQDVSSVVAVKYVNIREKNTNAKIVTEDK